MKFPKEKTPRDAEYLAWLRKQPCAICGAAPPSEVSHHGKRGTGIKASDYQTIPTCHHCHHTWHSFGRFPNWEHATREQMHEHLEKLWSRYRERYLRLHEGG